jgi:hypothetical protein
MAIGRFSRVIIPAGVVSVALGVSAAAILATTQGRTTPADLVPGVPVDLVQGAEARDHGVMVRATAASFSGTGTYVRLQLEFDDTSGVNIANVRRVVVPQDGKGGSPEWVAGLAPVVLGAFGKSDTTVRMQPITGPQPLAIFITAIDVQLVSGETTRINGNWRLAIDVPKDYQAATRVESLQGPAALDQGVGVSVLSALRSRSETLVTVQVSGLESPVVLGEPALVVGNRRLTGGVVDRKEQGTVLTLSFPPTAFGQDARLVLGPFTTEAAGRDAFTSIDLARVFGRQHVTGQLRESAAIGPGDIASANWATSPVRAVDFVSALENGVAAPLIRFTFVGNVERSRSEDLRAVLPSGKVVVANGWGSSYRKDGSGTIFEGTSDVSYSLASFEEWNGVVTIFHGKQSKIIRGEWSSVLSPAR